MLIQFIYERIECCNEYSSNLIENDSKSTVSSQVFHVPTIKKIIDINLALGMTDTVFFNKMADTFLLDPNLFIEAISDRTSEEIFYLSKVISFDLHATGRTNMVTPIIFSESPHLNAIAKLFYAEIKNEENYTLDSILPTQNVISQENTDMELMADSNISVSALSVSPTTPKIYTSVVVDVTVTKGVPVAATEYYTIKLFNITLSSTIPVKTQSISLTTENPSITSQMTITFNDAGSNLLQAKVYNDSGALVASSSIKVINVKGEWLIDVSLNSNRNLKGTLGVYNTDGKLLHSYECLGRSSSGADPSVYNGNTPTGTCKGYIVSAVDESLYGSYGPYERIYLQPLSGAIASYTHRGDFMIHGGSAESNVAATWYPLRPTLGCIRISNNNQKEMIETIKDLINNQYHDTYGKVVIWEY